MVRRWYSAGTVIAEMMAYYNRVGGYVASPWWVVHTRGLVILSELILYISYRYSYNYSLILVLYEKKVCIYDLKNYLKSHTRQFAPFKKTAP